jgi:DNA-binding MarR family transcriptional regulator
MKNVISFLFSLVKTNAILTRRLCLHGLDIGDFMILFYLNESPQKKLRRVDLAEKLGLTASGVTRMLLPLEKLGFVSRDLDKDDARARYAAITKNGKILLKDATATLEMKIEDFIPADKDSQIKNFTELLEEINSR